MYEIPTTACWAACRNCSCNNSSAAKIRRMSLLFCNAIDHSVSRIQPLVGLFSGCATVCGVDEFREVDPVIFRYPGSSTLGGSCIVPHWDLWEHWEVAAWAFYVPRVFIVQISMSYDGTVTSHRSRCGGHWVSLGVCDSRFSRWFRMDHCLLGWWICVHWH